MIEHVTMISRVAVACASLSDGAERPWKLKAIDGDDEQTEQQKSGASSTQLLRQRVRSTHARADNDYGR